MAQSRSFHRSATSCALLGALSINMVATSMAEAAPQPAPKKNFKIGSRSLQGRPETICVIEGKWADGAPLRVEGWDTCSMMHVRVVLEKDYKDAPSLGSDDQYGVADIPRGSEVLEITNNVSTTLIFRDRNGVQREILTQD